MLLPSTIALYSDGKSCFIQFSSLKFLRSVPDILGATCQAVWVVSVKFLLHDTLGKFEAFLILPQRAGCCPTPINDSLSSSPHSLFTNLWLVKSEPAGCWSWRRLTDKAPFRPPCARLMWPDGAAPEGAAECSWAQPNLRQTEFQYHILIHRNLSVLMKILLEKATQSFTREISQGGTQLSNHSGCFRQ